MGRLTDDMTRLSDEIAVLHRTCETCVSDVKDAVSALRAETLDMQAGFQRAHAEMSGGMKRKLTGFMSDLKENVTGLQTRFRDERTDNTRTTKANLMATVSGVKQAVDGLKRNVAAMRQEMADDIAGAHRAWCGRTDSKEPCGEHKEASASKTKKKKA